MVQLWDRSLDFSSELSQMRDISQMSSDEWPAWVSQGLVSDWDWGVFNPEAGVRRIQGSTRGQIMCSAGLIEEEGECVGTGNGMKHSKSRP